MRFASVVLDVDSTLCGVEGVDWLAQRRGADVAARTRALTERAMNGEIPLDSVYGESDTVYGDASDDLFYIDRYRDFAVGGPGDDHFFDGRLRGRCSGASENADDGPGKRRSGSSIHGQHVRLLELQTSRSVQWREGCRIWP